MEEVSKNGNVVSFLRTCVLIHCVALLQVSSVNCQTVPNTGFWKTSMFPFCVNFPRTLEPGQVIKIMGAFKERTEVYQSAPWLTVVLRRICLTADSPFYLKVRFDNQRIIRNSLQNGNWGDEETEGPFPFSWGAEFVLLIKVQSDGYKVTCNGTDLWTFQNRMPSEEVSVLEMNGFSSNIRRIELIDTADKDQQGSQIIYPVPVGPKPIEHPSFPFWGYFPEGLQAGKAIRITGIFVSNVQKTSINLCADCYKGPIMLHLDVRFKFGDDINKVIRNIYVDGDWGNYEYEERDGPFPFRIREQFTLLIKVQQDSYNISVDGRHCWTFLHRLPFTQVTSMAIRMDPMNIWSIEYIDQEERASEAVTSSEEDPRDSAVTFPNDSCILRISNEIILLVSLAWLLQVIIDAQP